MSSLSDLLKGGTSLSGRVVLEDEAEALTLAQVRELAASFAALFAKAGVSRGDRVLFVAENSARFVAALFAVLELGAVVCPVHHGNGGYRLRHFLRDTGATCVAADEGWMSRVNPESLGVPVVRLDSLTITLKPGREVFAEEHDTRGLAGIIYTSGSTGLPLGVRVGHAQALFCVDAISRVLGLLESDAILCGLPFSFDYGLFQIFLAFSSGARLVVRRGFRFPLSLPKDLRDRGITVLPAVPSLLALLLKSGLLERVGLPGLRLVTSTGDVLPGEHALRLKKLLPSATIVKMYGLTECKRVSVTPPALAAGREGSVGVALPGTSVRIEAKKGVAAQPGEVGELVVSGPHVMDGYWNDSQATRKRFWVDSRGVRHLRTGDLFRMDGEGFLYFVGRKGRLIKTSGHGVCPAELEEFLCTLPGVVEAAVVGIPCEERGTMVCAALTLDRRGELDAEKVRKLCARELPDYCIPTRLLLLRTPLPKTVNGKINRKVVRSMVAGVE